jgi:glucose/arabinose dehydrogenase
MQPVRPIVIALAVLSPISATAQTSSAGNLTLETVARGLEHPWSLAFLPDGKMLVTERPGRLRIVTRDGKISPPVSGVPPVRASGQGGLHDVVLDRDFASNRTIYFCYAEPASGGGRTAMARARFTDDEVGKLHDVKVIFRQEGPLSSGNHYGCRIVQGRDGNLWLTLGDHFTYRDDAQNLANHLGKIVRVTPDGAVPRDNPFVGRNGARPEIWSYGHRNSQGAALHPQTGKLWEHEHGPRGGDEVNIPLAGKNYGWPVIGYGVDYSGAKIHEATAKAGMEQPIKYWVPSIAPSGMAFYTGDLFPNWKGSLFVGALAGQSLVRLELDGETVTNEERLLGDLNARIRDVRQGPDGAIWLATDSSDGRIIRVTPAK